ncbi:MAG: phage holin family protein [Bacteroidales bacterium]|nr:phage holin family protein [Bacteroidales bacterium]
MASDDFTAPFRDIANELGKQVYLRTQLAGFVLSKKIAGMVSLMITMVLLAGIFSMIMLLLSFAFVFWYGSTIGSYAGGFLIMSLVFVVLGSVVFLNRKNWFLNPLVKKMNEKELLMDWDPDIPDPVIDNMKDLERHIGIARLQIKYSDLKLEQNMQRMAENLTPQNIFKILIYRSLQSTAVLSKILDFAISVLNGKPAAEPNAEEETEN